MTLQHVIPWSGDLLGTLLDSQLQSFAVFNAQRPPAVHKQSSTFRHSDQSIITHITCLVMGNLNIALLMTCRVAWRGSDSGV
jgi:hypothetical protein